MRSDEGPHLSSALCLEAVRACDELYELADADDRDLWVTYIVGRTMLQVRAAAEAWLVGAEVSAEVLDLIEAAACVDDPGAAASRLETFAEETLVLLERRTRRADLANHPGRRLADALAGTIPAGIAAESTAF